MIDIRKLHRLAKSQRPDFDSWWNAYKVAWLIGKAPEGLNERDLEWSWVLEEAGRFANGTRLPRLLDVGSLRTPLPEQLATLGFAVTALDLRESHGNGSAIPVEIGDIRNTSFADDYFDCITCVSTLEHIGVKGRFGVTESDPSGDQLAMAEMHRILKPKAALLLTIPVGQRDVLPVNKCYSSKRIQSLCTQFTICKAEVFSFISGQAWQRCGQEHAEQTNWYFSPWYALGCFHLEK